MRRRKTIFWWVGKVLERTWKDAMAKACSDRGFEQLFSIAINRNIFWVSSSIFNDYIQGNILDGMREQISFDLFLKKKNENGKKRSTILYFMLQKIAHHRRACTWSFFQNVKSLQLFFATFISYYITQYIFHCH